MRASNVSTQFGSSGACCKQSRDSQTEWSKHQSSWERACTAWATALTAHAQAPAKACWEL